jgi:hypothetical protein
VGIPNKRESCQERVSSESGCRIATCESQMRRPGPTGPGQEARSLQAPRFFGTIQPPEMEVSSARRGGSSGTTSNREELALEPADGSADLERQGERQQNPFCCRGPTQDRPSQKHRTLGCFGGEYTRRQSSTPGLETGRSVRSRFDPPRAAYRLTGWWQQQGGRSLVRVLHLTTIHRLRIGRSWIGWRGSFRAVQPLRWIPEFPGRDVAGANR